MNLVCKVPFIHEHRGYHPGAIVDPEVLGDRKSKLIKSGKVAFSTTDFAADELVEEETTAPVSIDPSGTLAKRGKKTEGA